MTEFEKILSDYRLTTAEILYHMPDHPQLLQSFLWQEYDIVPKYPILHRFLDFWDRELDGKIHSVRLEHCELIHPTNFRAPVSVLTIH